MIHNDMTSFENLFVKYQNMLTENSNLKEEIRILKARLAGVELKIPGRKDQTLHVALQGPG